MTNLAAEARANAQANWPGASVNARSRNWIRHEHPTNENRFILDSHVGPIHYGVSDDQEIDTAWVADTTDGFTHAMTANNFITRVRADQFDAGDIFRFEKDGEWLRFDPQSINWIDENTSRQQIAIKQNVVGAFNDDIVSFSEAYGPGRHFRYQNQTSRLQKLITIDAATDLPAVTLQGNDIWFEAEFSLSLSSGVNFWIDGVEWARANAVRVQTANQIEIRDTATGTNVLWWLEEARAWDSADSETVGQLEVRRQGGPSSLFITVRISKTWIDAATFPIYIDPTIDDQVGTGNDNATEIETGAVFRNPNNLGLNGADDWAAFRFDSVAVANGATITSAYQSHYIAIANDDYNGEVNVEDADNSTAIGVGANDISNRTFETAVSNVAADVGSPIWYDTPDQSSALENVVARGGWSSGNALLFVHKQTGAGNITITGYKTDSTKAAKLHIEYTTGGDSNAALLGQIRRRRFQPLLVR